jgi:Tfp pilus assembly protein FimT
MINRIIFQRCGFTVGEVLFTLGTLGVLLTIAMPQIQQVRLINTLDSGQQAVASTLLRARWLAINRGQQHFVTLSGSNVLQIRSGSATGTVVNSTDLSNYSVTVDDFTAFAFDVRGFLATSKTLTVRQPDLPATKNVIVGLYGKLTVQ